MFRNAQRDPLAVPEPVKRTSVGPTRRTAGDRQYGPQQGPIESPFHRDMPELKDLLEGDQDWDKYENVIRNSPTQKYGPELGPYHPGGEFPTDGMDWDKYQQLSEDHAQHEINRFGSRTANVLTREARNFLEDQNTEDRSELLYRAHRHASTQTSTWSENASRKATEAFVARVAELIPNRSSKMAAAQPSHIEDFDDQLLY